MDISQSRGSHPRHRDFPFDLQPTATSAVKTLVLLLCDTTGKAYFNTSYTSMKTLYESIFTVGDAKDH